MGRSAQKNYWLVIHQQSFGGKMKYLVGIIGICFLPFAVVFVAFEAACVYVANECNKE